MKFKCSICGKMHDGLPDLAFAAPDDYEAIPKRERRKRAKLDSDLCMIDGKDCYIRGCIEISIKRPRDVLAYGVWVAVSPKNFWRYVKLYDVDPPECARPWVGRLSNHLPEYPETLGLKTRIYLRPGGQRPRIELYSMRHPLAVHQREGVTLKQLLEIIGPRVHE